MQTIAQMFEEYRRVVMHSEAPVLQVRENKRAYYAGFWTAMTSMGQMPGIGTFLAWRQELEVHKSLVEQDKDEPR
jgi:hypothetical protein